MKNDARVKYTKMVLKDSLLALMREKPAGKITVKELCGRAGVNRATFYTHYQDVNDLLTQIEGELVDDIAGSLGHLAGNRPEDITELLRRILAAVSRNSELCRELLNEREYNEFLRRLITLGRDTGLKSWRSLAPGADGEQLENLYVFLASGCIAVIERWVRGGMRENADDLAVSLSRVAAGVVSVSL